MSSINLTNASIPFDARVYLGNPTLTPAIAFAGIYSLFLIIFGAHLLRRFSRIHVIASIFCVIRIGAFAVRGIIINSDWTSSGLLTADMIMMAAGFVAILDMMYQSLTQWLEFRVAPVHSNDLVSSAIRFKRLMHIVLVISAVLSIMGATAQSSATTPDDLDSAKDRVRIAALIYLGATLAMLALSTMVSLSVGGASAPLSARPGWVIVLCTIISLVRLTYAVIVAGKTPVELSWYCLSIMPEICVLIVFAWPGVAELYAKPREEMRMQSWELEKGAGGVYNDAAMGGVQPPVQGHPRYPPMYAPNPPPVNQCPGPPTVAELYAKPQQEMMMQAWEAEKGSRVAYNDAAMRAVQPLTLAHPRYPHV
ncbi:hypothetical protein BDK51DRAFT_26140 [Blyttiomyces helicus]|uniref:DUF7702 domain-containing protein n=1 Tax=Blyttiomyces helicus TaxID=388810 RepID=A0A4P9WIB7_9FUNG|nr:hypothetical protein BDK51DRAFT_26140 [Blyttiomyces helicus]|eukprot:RKO92601.1 hypothetical protein BDK51DRAFT_26140 [Blyttiomyces helicus]